MGHGFEVLRVDGDVLLVVLVGFEDADKDIEREALVGGENEFIARGGEALHLLDALLDGRGIEPFGEDIDGGVEAVRDLAECLVGIGESAEDVGGGFGGGVEGTEARRQGGTKARGLG